MVTYVAKINIDIGGGSDMIHHNSICMFFHITTTETDTAYGAYMYHVYATRCLMFWCVAICNVLCAISYDDKKRRCDMKDITLTWKHIFTIPAYLVCELSDNGTYELYDDKKEFIESDDLRVSIEISGGHRILLPCNSRIVLCDNGDLEIEALK